MATAESALEGVLDLISRIDACGWGLTLDRNRHGQWRVSRMVDTEHHELVSDSDLATVCQLALREVDRLSADGPLPSPGGSAMTIPRLRPPVATADER